MTFAIHSFVDHLFRRQSAQIVSTLTRALSGRHLDLAEEAVQDALVTALQQWPYRGVPDDPAAWLFRAARTRALDRQLRKRKSPVRVRRSTKSSASRRILRWRRPRPSGGSSAHGSRRWPTERAHAL